VENGNGLVYSAGEKGKISEAIASINQRTLHRVAQNMVKQVIASIQENLLWTLFQVLLYSYIVL
jgi:hypothetical protein